MSHYVPTCSINEFEKVSELYVPPIYLSYPNVLQRQVIPSDLLQKFEGHWNHSRIISPPLTIHLLKDVYVCSEGLVFTKDGTFITETTTQHSQDDIKEAADFLAYNLACGTVKNRHKNGILCKKRGANNYGHWLAEMLPKAFFASRELKLNSEWPAIVHNSSTTLKNIISQSLNVIGFTQENTIFCDQAPTHFEELLVVDGLTQHAWFMSPLVFECMEFIAERAPKSQVEKIYIPRHPAKTRNFINEDSLKPIFFDHGYKEVVCADLPFLEQVSVFKGAKSVSGPMGAALTNTLFCKTNTDLLLFMPATAHEYFFWHISEGKKLNYTEVRCEEIGPKTDSLPWNKSIDLSETFLRELLTHA